MGGAWKDELGETQLANPAKALEGRRLNDLPHRVLELIGAEFDQIVNRVANALGLWSRQIASSDSMSEALSV
jgi:hypothetical protein